MSCMHMQTSAAAACPKRTTPYVFAAHLVCPYQVLLQVFLCGVAVPDLLKVLGCVLACAQAAAWRCMRACMSA